MEEHEKWRLRVAALFKMAQIEGGLREGGFDLPKCMGMSAEDMGRPVAQLIALTAAPPWRPGDEVRVVDWKYVCERLEEWLDKPSS